MKLLQQFSFALLILVLAAGCFAKEEASQSSSLQSTITKELVLGKILGDALEKMHFSKKQINDELSVEAFAKYIERLDYTKQFLLQRDIDALKTYEKKMDDQFRSGNLEVISVSSKIMQSRIKELEKFVIATLSKPISLTQKETIETDPKKRKFLKTMDELKERWRKMLKLEVMNRYVDLKEEQEGTSEDYKDKKKKKVIPEVKLSEKELEEKARERTLKSYGKLFKRLAEEKKNDQLDKFYNSITKIFDPHTQYLIPEDKEDFDIDMSGKLEGIGALLREEGSYIKVENIIPGSASWKGKELEAEDIILKVAQGREEPIDVVDMNLKDAVKLIRGPKGSEVRLTVKKPNGLVKVISIVREVVEIEESYAKSTILEHKELGVKVGYIFVPKFYRDFNSSKGRNCSDDVRDALRKLNEKNVNGVILDLRNNGGGALEDARIMSGLFVEKGPIVQVKNIQEGVEVLADTDSKVEFTKPVVVLINRFSASASEIVAAALQDYGRAIVVGGEFTHGKGTVQAVLDLDRTGMMGAIAGIMNSGGSGPGLGALKITIQQFYRINGSSTQYNGVTPDIVLPDPVSYLESGERFLDHSLPWNRIKPVKFTPWPEKYNITDLKKKSEKRVSASPKFKKINESIKWYETKKENSEKTLVLTEYLKHREYLKTTVDKFKIEDENEKISVIPIESMKTSAAKEKFTDFSETLRKDPYIEETLHIFKDLFEQKS
jgi:carboxyl-terminal processing protease